MKKSLANYEHAPESLRIHAQIQENLAWARDARLAARAGDPDAWADAYYYDDQVEMLREQLRSMGYRPNPTDARGRASADKPLRDPKKLKKTKIWAGGKRVLLNRSQEPFEYVGCVVNPKFMRPYFVVGRPDGSGSFYVTVPTTDMENLEIVGKGDFEYDEYCKHAAPSKHYGAPRIHTPAGVAEQGTGLGTALYTGACLMGSYLVANKGALSSIPKAFLQTPGCSSGPGANRAAATWWEGAVDRGLAEEAEGRGERPRKVAEESSRIYTNIGWRDIFELSKNKGWRFKDELLEEIEAEASKLLKESVAGDIDWDSFEVSIDRVYTVVDYAFPAVAKFEIEDDQGQTAKVEVSVDFGSIPSAGQLDFFSSLYFRVEKEAQRVLKEEFELDQLNVPLGFGDITRAVLEDVSFHEDAEKLAVYYTANAYYTKIREKPVIFFLYPLENALHDLLIIDMNETLVNAYGEKMPTGKSLLEVVLNLDLSEVLDPDVLPLFFGMAESAGATPAQLREFVERNTLRDDLPRELIEREYIFDDLLGFKPGLTAKGVRVNPEPDFEAIGEAIYGDLVDLG